MARDEGEHVVMNISGTCDERFLPVKAAFAAAFERGEEVGASVAVTLDGEFVVDLWAGDAVTPGGAEVADDAAVVPWRRDTIVNVYSLTKTMAATCVLLLADEGELDLDAPVASLWPAFEAEGKRGVLVRHVMGHTAGLSGFDPAIAPEVLYDHDRVAEHLARQPLWWEPGTLSGYHALTQGYLLGEVVRRVTGESIGAFFRHHVAEPLGADFHIWLPESEEPRVGRLIPPPPGDPGRAISLGGAVLDADSIAVRTMLSCPLTGRETGDRAWRAAEIPAAGGTGNARSVAMVHRALACGGTVDGVRLMSAAGVERALVQQADNVDLVLGTNMRMGTGFGLMNDTVPLSPNPRACFWGGWGGSLSVIDLDARLTVSYVMNRMASNLVGDLRGALLVFAAYESLTSR